MCKYETPQVGRDEQFLNERFSLRNFGSQFISKGPSNLSTYSARGQPLNLPRMVIDPSAFGAFY